MVDIHGGRAFSIGGSVRLAVAVRPELRLSRSQVGTVSNVGQDWSYDTITQRAAVLFIERLLGLCSYEVCRVHTAMVVVCKKNR